MRDDTPLKLDKHLNSYVKNLKENPNPRTANALIAYLNSLIQTAQSDEELDLLEKVYPEQVKYVRGFEMVVAPKSNYFEEPIYGYVNDVDMQGRVEVALGHEGFTEWFDFDTLITKEKNPKKFDKIVKKNHEDDL